MMSDAKGAKSSGLFVRIRFILNDCIVATMFVFILTTIFVFILTTIVYQHDWNNKNTANLQKQKSKPFNAYVEN